MRSCYSQGNLARLGVKQVCVMTSHCSFIGQQCFLSRQHVACKPFINRTVITNIWWPMTASYSLAVSSSGSNTSKVLRHIDITRNCTNLLDRHMWHLPTSLETKVHLYKNVHSTDTAIWLRDLVLHDFATLISIGCIWHMVLRKSLCITFMWQVSKWRLFL